MMFSVSFQGICSDCSSCGGLMEDTDEDDRRCPRQQLGEMTTGPLSAAGDARLVPTPGGAPLVIIDKETLLAASKLACTRYPFTPPDTGRQGQEAAHHCYPGMEKGIRPFRPRPLQSAGMWQMGAREQGTTLNTLPASPATRAMGTLDDGCFAGSQSRALLKVSIQARAKVRDGRTAAGDNEGLHRQLQG